MGRLLTIEELEKLDINHDRDWHMVILPRHSRVEFIDRFMTDNFSNEVNGMYHNYQWTFWFENEKDALWFRLKWG